MLDFVGLAKAGDVMAEKFDQLVALLTQIRDSNAAILAAIEKSNEDKSNG